MTFDKKNRPWHATDARATQWEGVRRSIHPRPTTKEFLQMCDDVVDSALEFSPHWEPAMLWEYVAHRVKDGHGR